MGGLSCLGARDVVGFDFGTLFQAAGGLTSGIASEVEADQATQKASADEQKKLTAAIAADVAATAAAARAATSSASHAPSASVDAIAAQTTAAAQDAAGAGLSADSVTKRAAAASKALTDAIARAQASPKDANLQALVKAWTATVNKLQNGAIVSSSDDGSASGKGGGKGKSGKGSSSSGSWFTRPVLGPIPGVGVLVGAAGIAGIGALVIKKVFFK